VKEHPFNKSDLMESYKMLLVEQEDSLLNEHLNPDYILLREDPKINLDRLLNLYKPKILISDGSNAPWNAEFWLQTCLKKGIIFHDTRSQGALEINL
jgi:competence protein ComEC